MYSSYIPQIGHQPSDMGAIVAFVGPPIVAPAPILPHTPPLILPKSTIKPPPPVIIRKTAPKPRPQVMLHDNRPSTEHGLSSPQRDVVLIIVKATEQALQLAEAGWGATGVDSSPRRADGYRVSFIASAAWFRESSIAAPGSA